MKHPWGFPRPGHGPGVAPEHLHPLLTVEPPPALAPLWTQELTRRGGAGLRDPCPPLPAPREDGRHLPAYSSRQSRDPRALSFRSSAHLRSTRPMPAQGTHWVYSGGETAPRRLPSGAHKIIAKREGYATGHLAFPLLARGKGGQRGGAVRGCGGGDGGIPS